MHALFVKIPFGSSLSSPSPRRHHMVLAPSQPFFPGQLWHTTLQWHHNGMMASQITSLTIVYSTVYSGADQRKHQSSASLAFVRGIHQGAVNSPHKWPVTRKMFHHIWCWITSHTLWHETEHLIFLFVDIMKLCRVSTSSTNRNEANSSLWSILEPLTIPILHTLTYTFVS